VSLERFVIDGALRERTYVGQIGGKRVRERRMNGVRDTAPSTFDRPNDGAPREGGVTRFVVGDRRECRAHAGIACAFEPTTGENGEDSRAASACRVF
jgi:hypothetical protein